MRTFFTSRIIRYRSQALRRPITLRLNVTHRLTVPPLQPERDPFFQEPLTAGPEDLDRTRELFVGRTKDLRLLGNQVVGAGARASTRAVVSGAPGVGKTSLVNRLKNELATEKSPAVLCAASPVRIQAGMTPDDFRAEVLRTLLLIRSTLLDDRAQDGDNRSDAESRAERDFWRRAARMLNGEDVETGGFSVSAGGTGIGMSRAVSRIASERRSLSLHSELAQAFTYLARRGKRRTLVHVNNLENLSTDAVTAAQRLVQNIRDDLLLPESHWLFVGTTDIIESVITAGPTQVQGIFPVVAGGQVTTTTTVLFRSSLISKALNFVTAGLCR